MGRDVILLIIISVVVVLGNLRCCNGAGLSDDFYKKSCPEAELIVKNITWNRAASNPVLGAKLLRMHFHDCFVRGCDASVLLDGDGNGEAEKDTIPNGSLSGYDVIDDIKEELERVCPGVVSCADILALSARDSVSFQFEKNREGDDKVEDDEGGGGGGGDRDRDRNRDEKGGGKLWKVQTGRRDGSISLASEANENLPSPFADFETLKQLFAQKNLNVNDLVVLSGAHTLGVAHCATFSDTRLYSFNETTETDPTLNSRHARFLKTKCPNPANPSTTVEMDHESSLKFDNTYYDNLVQRKGLLTSDASLLTSRESSKIVVQLRRSSEFFKRFDVSMKRMGAIEVLTGDVGEIRKNCRRVNP